MLNERTAQFAREHGEWTAMAIKLPDGTYTREPAVDHRLRRLLQVASDVSKKPLEVCRVLDLACLEGHYAIEFAMHGADALGTEGRAVSVAKCDYAKDVLGLSKLRFVQADVRNFSAADYGQFDIIVCSGILYHLAADDAWRLLQALREACSGILLLDTFISVTGRESAMIEEQLVQGHYYHEHVDEDDKEAKFWASLDNNRSFWFTAPSLMNLLVEAGFTSVMDVLVPDMPGNLHDRKTYLAVAGKEVPILTSDPTRDFEKMPIEELGKPRVDASQHPKSWVHQAAKSLLPQPVKEVIKPSLRLVGILPPDTTPEFMRKKRK
jgi:SAM-dependent methyltransferase